MKSKRAIAIIVSLLVLALLVMVAQFRPADEPTYQGKTASVWFKEHAFATNALIGARVISFTITRVTPKGNTVQVVQVPTNRPPWTAGPLGATFGEPMPGPAWEALQALGSNAVPCLVRRLRFGLLDHAYERAFTNLPAFAQRRLPNPARKNWLRTKALNTITKLGDDARPASPALLEMLKRRDGHLRPTVITALRSIHTDRRSITDALLEIGAQQRYADMMAIAGQTGWEGGEMVHLLGQLLNSPDVTLRRDAIRLLEAAGADAAPAMEQIFAALNSPDSEVRYLSARSLEAISEKASPEIRERTAQAMRSRQEDENAMVRNVARRTLLKLAPDAVSPSATNSAGRISGL